MLIASLAQAAVSGTPHDFRANAAYPNLAQFANGKLCTPCHAQRAFPAPPDYQNDFPGGIPMVTDSTYISTIGIGPRLNPNLPQAMFCLGCHDGVIHTPTGSDTIPGDPQNNNANLNWSAGGSHNIWGMGQDSAAHPVQIHYPPVPSEKMHDPFSTAPVAADNNRVRGQNGDWFIVDTTISSVALPLVTDPADPDKSYVTCISCHDPHGRSADVTAIKRLEWPDLCWMCHRRR